MPRINSKKLKRVDGELRLAALESPLASPKSRPPTAGVPLKRCTREFSLHERIQPEEGNNLICGAVEVPGHNLEQPVIICDDMLNETLLENRRAAVASGPPPTAPSTEPLWLWRNVSNDVFCKECGKEGLSRKHGNEVDSSGNPEDSSNSGEIYVTKIIQMVPANTPAASFSETSSSSVNLINSQDCLHSRELDEVSKVVRAEENVVNELPTPPSSSMMGTPLSKFYLSCSTVADDPRMSTLEKHIFDLENNCDAEDEHKLRIATATTVSLPGSQRQANWSHERSSQWSLLNDDKARTPGASALTESTEPIPKIEEELSGALSVYSSSNGKPPPEVQEVFKKQSRPKVGHDQKELPVVTSPPQVGEGDSVGTPFSSESGDGCLSRTAYQHRPPHWGVPNTPPSARAPFQITFRRHSSRLRPRSIITNRSTLSSALPTATSSAPDSTASPPTPRRNEENEKDSGVTITEVPNSARDEPNNNDGFHRRDPNNNTTALVAYPIITEVASKHNNKITKTKEINNNNTSIEEMENVDENDNPVQKSRKLSKSILGLNRDALAPREFVVMEAGVESPDEDDGAATATTNATAAIIAATTRGSSQQAPRSTAPVVVPITSTTGYSPTFSGSTPYYSRTGSYSTTQSSDSSSTEYTGPADLNGFKLNTPAEKGAIRFFLPGRIQHKTTIKVSHFPTGDNKSLVFKLGDNEENDECDECDDDDPGYPPPNPNDIPFFPYNNFKPVPPNMATSMPTDYIDPYNPYSYGGYNPYSSPPAYGGYPYPYY